MQNEEGNTFPSLNGGRYGSDVSKLEEDRRVPKSKINKGEKKQQLNREEREGWGRGKGKIFIRLLGFLVGVEVSVTIDIRKDGKCRFENLSRQMLVTEVKEWKVKDGLYKVRQKCVTRC